ncbi:Y-family DNA polymerase [Psychrobacter fulvigenes]|uniref:Y-family DNA polymerase n=1 Tax=Psychrobacter fulvigenes TaxID=533323 RepID=UPI001D11088A|nr:hypothetical protein [Psychrobacter fulvigenes]
MYALIDCNSFYANCEKLFRPDLRGKAVVVLSNNDVCVVARSNEAKLLGIKMGVPYFQVKDFCKKNDVIVFSSNYTLYADMSHRMMSTLEKLCPTVEVYSIDEAFLYLADYLAAMTDLNAYGTKLKAIVEQYTGIPVCVGMSSTNTMAKLANYAAKKHPATKSVCVLDNLRWIRRIMQITDVGEVWGVGRRYKVRLNEMGTLTACHKDIVIALVDDGFTAKQLILGEHIILRAHNDNYTDIVVKGSLELFGVVASSIRRFKR